MEDGTKLGLLGGGVAVLVGGLAYMTGRQRKRDAVMDPSYQTPTAPTALNAVDLAVFEQGMVRLAMQQAALDKATMDRLYALAIKGGLPKTAMTIKSIATDGKPGGPNYVATPGDEMWPGSTMSVRDYLAQKMAALKAGVA